MSFDEWLAHDPAQNDRTCEVCESQAGEQKYRWQWVCDECKELLTEEEGEDEE